MGYRYGPPQCDQASQAHVQNSSKSLIQKNREACSVITLKYCDLELSSILLVQNILQSWNIACRQEN